MFQRGRRRYCTHTHKLNEAFLSSPCCGAHRYRGLRSAGGSGEYVSCRCMASNDGVDDASSASAEPAVAAIAASAAATEEAGEGNALALVVDVDDEEEDEEGADAGLEGVSDAGRADAVCDEEEDDDEEEEVRCRLMPSKNGCLSASAADRRRAGSNASR
jgi:hypothetical protein